MRITWDPKKSFLNLLKHGKRLTHARRLMKGLYVVTEATEKGELRWKLWGYLDGKPWLCVIAKDKRPYIYRVISLRRVTKKKELKYYVQNQTGL